MMLPSQRPGRRAVVGAVGAVALAGAMFVGGLATPSALSDSAPGSATYWELTILAATRRAAGRAVIAVVSHLCGTVGCVVSQVGPALVR